MQKLAEETRNFGSSGKRELESKTRPTCYKCDICQDEEFIFYEEDGRNICEPCTCQPLRISERRLAKTELAHKKDLYTFEKYEAYRDWQIDALEKAKAYAKDPAGRWFFIGGQVGAGKTHLCTATMLNLSRNYNLTFDYMLFNKKINELKQLRFDQAERFEDEIYKISETQILFIDDLFKIEPSRADLDLLFEILNDKYLNGGFVIISSEKHLTDIIKIDEAIGSRIFEKTGKNAVNISFDKSKNYRLKDLYYSPLKPSKPF